MCRGPIIHLHVSNLVLVHSPSGRGQKRTFFITPTASSVTPTRLSSFRSTSARCSSLIGRSSSPLLPFPLAFVASSPNLAFSTPLLALVANIRLVFNVVLQPAKNLCWICWSCAKRTSPTFSLAKAYFSKAVANGSSSLVEEGLVWMSN